MPSKQKTDADRIYDANQIIIGKNSRIRELERQLRERTQINLSAEKVRKEIMGLDEYTLEPPKWIEKKPSGRTTGVPLLMITDLHHGEYVDKDQTGGVNEFNRKISKKRIERLHDAANDLCFHHMTNPNYPGIVICLGGDLITGDIHDDLKETNDGPVTVSVLEVEELMIAFIESMADKFGRVFVPCVPGNHGRNTLKPRAKNAVFNSYEWLIYCRIERHFKKDSRVTVHVPNEVDAHFAIYDHRFMLTHGDNMGVKGGDGIIGALGPIARGAMKVGASEAQIGRDFDTLLIGHYHVYIPRGEAIPVLANGCVIGYNEYARLKLRARPSPPTQALAFIHPERGFTAQWAIQLDEKGKKDKVPWCSWVDGKLKTP